MNKYFTHSFLYHFFLAVLFLLIWRLSPQNVSIEVPVYVKDDTPNEIQDLKQIVEKPQVRIKTLNTPSESKMKTREIFGLSRQSLTDDSNPNGIEVKKGNTTAKAADHIKMTDEDSDALPAPTEEYLVSDMPKVLNEVKPNYPEKAKVERIQGTVIMDILIDQNGNVRTVDIIESNKLFITEAIAAMKRFKFSPAKVDGKSVAVKIRYSMRFILEN